MKSLILFDGKGSETLPQFEPAAVSRSPTQRKPSFPQRLPDAAAPGRLCIHQTHTTSQECCRTMLLSRPCFASGLRPPPSARPAASSFAAVDSETSLKGSPPHMPFTRRARRICHAACDLPPPWICWLLLSLQGIRGGFATAKAGRPSSLALAPAQMFSGFQILFLRSYSHDF